MNKKPIIIISTVVVLAACAFFFFQGRLLNKPQKNEITQFLISFDNSLKTGNVDSIQNMFETKLKPELLNRLLFILANRSAYDGKTVPLFNLTRKIDDAKITIVNTELAQVKIPIDFTNEKISFKETFLKLKLRKLSTNNFKIVQVDAIQFMSDYIAFQNKVKASTLTDDQIYSPVTLAAFKTAGQLKARYDSVIWFAHTNDEKTYFYVVKGKWGYDPQTQGRGEYGMGLVSPDLKEIIPPQYDLIHNINGTLNGLVEVEKNNKKGFYNLNGKVVLTPVYDQILPIEDENNLALLRLDNDYYYLKNDSTVSEKVNIDIGSVLPQIKKFGKLLSANSGGNGLITEVNSRDDHGCVYVAPSYLVDLNLVEQITYFENPLRKNVEYMGVTGHYNVNYDTEIQPKEPDSWLVAAFYSIRDYYIGGREEFYDSKRVLVVDKKRNRLMGQTIATDYTPEGGGRSLTGICDVTDFKAINDSLFEVKVGASMYAPLYDSTKTLSGGPIYHYLAIKNNKLTELPNSRTFGFTKYVKMDDSYLEACYKVDIDLPLKKHTQEKTINHLTPEFLRYMKNEIFADYAYQFKDARWEFVFSDREAYSGHLSRNKPNNINVDDSLTVIDKYNINFINQKLKGVKTPPTALAAN